MTGEEVKSEARLGAGMLSASIPGTDCMIVRKSHYERLQDARRKCAECGGDGVNRRSFGYVPCEACNGKGY